MEKNYIWLDGKYLRYSDAKIAPLTHSLSYATSVYEGIRSYRGVIFKLPEHITRLRKSAAVFGHTLIYDDDFLCSVSYELLKNNNLTDAYIKIQLFYDDGDISYKGGGCKSHILITILPMIPAIRKKEAILAIAKWRRPPVNCHPYMAKTSSTYALSFLSFRDRDLDADDVLFLSTDEEVCEASGANIFFIKGNTLITPTTEKCLAGITRETVINELSPALGLKTEIRIVHSMEMGNFDAAFLCGTAVEIHEVSQIGSIQYPENKHVTKLEKSYKELVMQAI